MHYRRNIFNIPSGKAGKDFIKELTFWIKQFNTNSELNAIAIKTYMILPTLILQKSSAKSKTKEHISSIERRLIMWRRGDLDSIMKEIRFIQKRFTSCNKPRPMEEVSKIFAKLVMQGKLTAALKFLDKESTSGVLSISKDVINDLKEKHPDAAPAMEGSLLVGPKEHVPFGIFEVIDEEMIKQAAMKTKGSAGPSGMDVDLYRRILCSKNFNAEGKELREELAKMTRNILSFNYHYSLLES